MKTETTEIDRLAEIILDYESNTFDLVLTPKDAIDMARVLFDRLCKIVAEGGTLRCDGDVLWEVYDQVQAQESEHA